MKKILFGLAIAATFAAITACNETKPLIYSVKGNVSDSLNGQNVTLYVREIQDKQIASTVIENGQFEFSDTIESPLVATVVIGNEKKHEYGCVLDEVPVVMNFDGQEFQVTGSHRTNAMVAYGNIEKERSGNLKKNKYNIPYLLSRQREGKPLTEEEIREKDEIAKHNEAVLAKSLKDKKELLKRNTDNVVGAYVFGRLYNGNGIGEEIALQDSILSVASKEFLETTVIQRVLAAHNQRVGKTYTDFELPDKEGKMHKLSDYVGEGKYVLVDVWASWCLGCRMESPHVIEAYKKYHDRGFDVVMVSIDSDEGNTKWLKAMEQDSITNIGYQLIDPDSKIRKLYGIASIPCSMLIDPQGKIIANDLRNDDLENILSKKIGE